MRNILIIILCLALVGCTSASERKSLEQQVMQLQNALTKSNEEINNLQILLKDKENQIKEKEKKIEELRNKLEMFGVFEK